MVNCNICGRPLTAPKSVARGVGPVCWAKLKRGELDLVINPEFEKVTFEPTAYTGYVKVIKEAEG